MARNLLTNSQAVTKARDSSIYILGWFSLLIAAVGGAYAAEAWIGDLVATVVGWAPAQWELPNLLLALGAIAFAIDLIADLTPNRPALFFVILAPTVATAGDGTLAAKISEWSEALQGGVGGGLSAWVGATSASVLAIIAIVASQLMARRVLSKQQVAAGMGR